MIDCDRFVGDLAAILADDPPEAERERMLGALFRHASSCETCDGSRDLVELLALPPGERDLVDPPPDDYWSRLADAVHRRVAADERRTPGRRYGWAAVAAAAILAGVFAVWIGVRSGPADGMLRPVNPTAAALNPVGPDLPSQLERLLRQAGPGQARAGLEFLAGLDGMDEADLDTRKDPGDGLAVWERPLELSPDMDGLDDESREALLLWLRQASSAAPGVES